MLAAAGDLARPPVAAAAAAEEAEAGRCGLRSTHFLSCSRVLGDFGGSRTVAFLAGGGDFERADAGFNPSDGRSSSSCRLAASGSFGAGFDGGGGADFAAGRGGEGLTAAARCLAVVGRGGDGGTAAPPPIVMSDGSAADRCGGGRLVERPSEDGGWTNEKGCGAPRLSESRSIATPEAIFRRAGSLSPSAPSAVGHDVVRGMAARHRPSHLDYSCRRYPSAPNAHNACSNDQPPRVFRPNHHARHAACGRHLDGRGAEHSVQEPGTCGAASLLIALCLVQFARGCILIFILLCCRAAHRGWRWNGCLHARS